MDSFIKLPKRTKKPRSFGVNLAIDNGYPTGFFQDVIESHGALIDYVKFGWGTALITKDIERKIAVAKAHDIAVFFGGTFFEKAYLQGQFDAYMRYLDKFGIQWMEISNGTIDMDNHEKAKQIESACQHFNILSEVGFKDSARSQELQPTKWIEYIQEDFAAGSKWVITESRESGTSGICRSNGEVRIGLIKEIAEAKIDISKLIFEAPNKALQIYFIKAFGSNVNLGNISFLDIIGMETLRLGLRGDTLLELNSIEELSTVVA
ncbi:MAG: phosphosulfolactate synthase [Coxiellaceae bacterium]|nr:phosphosulfolactate synthase [Coxiellaceae bacterium]